MKLRTAFRLTDSQQGFTLVEVIAALAITGLIGIGAATATVQVLTHGSRNVEYTAVSRQAMNAVYWVSRDAQMSQNVTTESVSGFPLTLRWTEWDNSEHLVIYDFEDDLLMRSYSIDGGTSNETIVAHYINSISENTTCSYSERVLTLKVTATIGEGAHTVSISRVREITPRPGL